MIFTHNLKDSLCQRESQLVEKVQRKLGFFS